MNRFAKIASVAALLISAAACTGPYHHYGPAGQYDVYYDGYYGNFAGGYWGPDGYFYYSDGHGSYRRDDDHHFRRDRFENGSPYHADQPPHAN